MSPADYASFERRAGVEFDAKYNRRYKEVRPKGGSPTSIQCRAILSLLIEDIGEIAEKLLPGVTIVPADYITAKAHGKEIVKAVRHDGDIYTIAEIAATYQLATNPDLQKYAKKFGPLIDERVLDARKSLLSSLNASEDKTEIVRHAILVFEQNIGHSNLADKDKKLENVKKLGQTIIHGLENRT